MRGLCGGSKVNKEDTSILSLFSSSVSLKIGRETLTCSVSMMGSQMILILEMHF